MASRVDVVRLGLDGWIDRWMYGRLVLEMLWKSVSISSAVCVGKEGRKGCSHTSNHKADKQGCLCRILSYPKYFQSQSSNLSFVCMYVCMYMVGLKLEAFLDQFRSIYYRKKDGRVSCIPQAFVCPCPLMMWPGDERSHRNGEAENSRREAGALDREGCRWLAGWPRPTFFCIKCRTYIHQEPTAVIQSGPLAQLVRAWC